MLIEWCTWAKQGQWYIFNTKDEKLVCNIDLIGSRIVLYGTFCMSSNDCQYHMVYANADACEHVGAGIYYYSMYCIYTLKTTVHIPIKLRLSFNGGSNQVIELWCIVIFLDNLAKA